MYRIHIKQNNIYLYILYCEYHKYIYLSAVDMLYLIIFLNHVLVKMPLKQNHPQFRINKVNLIINWCQ